ncbi:TolC family protein [Chryseolinea sp. H1M3-3]|uniref:TolC family protein n=1 Tax=Chryseolinea sp. H1M3-3 TaxID=3034144 RepID=UPI00320BAC30
MRTILISIMMLMSVTLLAQQHSFSLDEAIDYALKNNSNIQALGYEVESQRQIRKASIDLPKTDVTLLYGQYNSYAKNDNNISVTQSIPFSAFGSQGKLNRALLVSSGLRKASSENELVYQVKQIYNDLAWAYSNRDLLLQQDSIFEGFYKAASLRYQAGETRLLEQTSADAQRNQAKIGLAENETQIHALRSDLMGLLNTSELPDIVEKRQTEHSLSLSIDTLLIASSPSLAYVRHQIDVAERERKLQSAKAAPDLLIGFFNQTLIGTTNPETGAIATSGERFSGIQLGVSIPLWFGPAMGRIKASVYNKKATESNYEAYKKKLLIQMDQAIKEYQTYKASLNYYRSSALPNADLILKQSQAAFKGGEIEYSEFLLGLRNAIEIRERFLQTLRKYNQSIIQIEFLSGDK